MKLAFGL